MKLSYNWLQTFLLVDLNNLKFNPRQHGPQGNFSALICIHRRGYQEVGHEQNGGDKMSEKEKRLVISLVTGQHHHEPLSNWWSLHDAVHNFPPFTSTPILFGHLVRLVNICIDLYLQDRQNWRLRVGGLWHYADAEQHLGYPCWILFEFNVR